MSEQASIPPAIHVAPSAPSLVPAYILATGTFAIGTEGFMIAPLLPRMAEDFSRPLSTVALLVTAFTLTLAITSPILTVITAGINRRALLISAMAAFALANFAAWASQDFFGIFIARLLLAVAAGLYVPNANALAGATVAPEKRGQALAIVSGGMTIAIALGLPLGSLVGQAFGWRATFLGVGILGAFAVVGLVLGLDRHVGSENRVAGLGERVRIARQREVLRPLLITAFWSMGAYAAYPFIAPYLREVVGFSDIGITAVVSLWGASAAAGVVLGGILNDRLGSSRVIVPSLAVLGSSFLILAAAAAYLPKHQALLPILVAVALWGITVWSFFPAQMARLIRAGGPPNAPVVLSLNTSVMYAGFAAGSGIGSLVIAGGTVSELMLVAALMEFIALVLFLAFGSRKLGRIVSGLD